MSIEIQIKGTSTARTQFCVGEILTLVCRNDTIAYLWKIQSVTETYNLVVTRGFPMYSINNFTVTLVSDTESTLMFEASMNLNGSEIRCLNGYIPAPLFSSTTLLLHGEVFVSKH